MKCCADSKIDRINLTCDECGKNFERIRSRCSTEKGYSGNFCDKRCEKEFRLKNKGKKLGHKLNCQFCKNEFYSKKKKTLFCSNQCRSLADRRRIDVVCARSECQKPFQITKSKYEKGNRHFCSQSCCRKTQGEENKKPPKLKTYNCQNCLKDFERPNQTRERKFCSNECFREKRMKDKGLHVNCDNCGKPLRITVADLKFPHHFCNRSCLGIHRQNNKTWGHRRSKVEFYLEEKLKELYPNLTILPSDKTAIKRELDLYITEIKMGIEINGPFHYFPIYGEESFERTRKNDKIKKKLCRELKIDLVIVKHTSFNLKGANKILNRLIKLIDSKICKL